jgi:hypothetical protein
MMRSSSGVHAVFVISGLKWWFHRSRHCLPTRPALGAAPGGGPTASFRARAIALQLPSPYWPTRLRGGVGWVRAGRKRRCVSVHSRQASALTAPRRERAGEAAPRRVAAGSRALAPAAQQVWRHTWARTSSEGPQHCRICAAAAAPHPHFERRVLTGPPAALEHGRRLPAAPRARSHCSRDSAPEEGYEVGVVRRR